MQSTLTPTVRQTDRLLSNNTYCAHREVCCAEGRDPGHAPAQGRAAQLVRVGKRAPKLDCHVGVGQQQAVGRQGAQLQGGWDALFSLTGNRKFLCFFIFYFFDRKAQEGQQGRAAGEQHRAPKTRGSTPKHTQQLVSTLCMMSRWLPGAPWA